MSRVRPGAAWGALLGAGLIYEMYGLHGGVDGDTLSEVIRATVRADTVPGKVVFVALWAGLSVWIIPHIVVNGSGSTVGAYETS